MNYKMSVLFYGKAAKKTKDNLVPIYLRITIDGQRIEQTTQRYVDPGKWSSDTGRVKGASAEAKKINDHLELLKSQVYDCERQLIQAGENISYTSFKKKWQGETEKAIMLMEVFQHHNDQMKHLVGKEFAFYLKNPGTAWHDNRMTNHGKGLVINQGSIGDQGSAAIGSTSGVTFNNVWAAPSAWNATDHLQTWVDGGISATYSRLFVKNLSSYLPAYNDAAFPLEKYALSSGSLVPTSSPSATPCPALPSMIMGSGRFRFRLHEQIVQKQVSYPTDSASNDWLGQYTIWQSVKQDTTQLDSSTVLQSFNGLAANSRFAVLTGIENSLAQGDSSTAMTAIYTPDAPLVGTGTYQDSTTGVVIADDTSGDYLMATYKNFYSLYLRYASGNLSTDDSTMVVSIANYCPAQYGAVVYRARSLYVALYNDLPVWNDDSCGVSDSTRAIIASRQSHGNTGVTDIAANQVYSLFPNPNDGNLTIQNAEGGDFNATVEVLSISGQSVYRESSVFSSGKTTVKLGNVASGLYILKLTDDKNRTFTFRFIVK